MLRKLGLLCLLLASCRAARPAAGNWANEPRELLHAKGFPQGFELPSDLLARSGIKNSEGSTCRNVWGKVSPICKPTQLLMFGTEEMQKLEDHKDSIIQKLIEIARAISKKVVKGISKAIKGNGRDHSKRFGRNLKVSKIDRVGNKISSILKNFKQYGKNMNTCWKYLKKAREASLCYICSGSNSEYFTSSRALISDETCDSMLSSCSGFASSMLAVLKGLLRLYGLGRNANRWPRATKLERLSELATKAELPTLLLQLMNPLTSADLRTETSRRLCLRLFTLHKPPIFTALQAATAQIVDAVQQDGRELRKSDSREVKQTYDSFESVFQGDAAILIKLPGADKQLAAMFGDLVVTPLPHTRFRPLNLTNLFFE